MWFNRTDVLLLHCFLAILRLSPVHVLVLFRVKFRQEHVKVVIIFFSSLSRSIIGLKNVLLLEFGVRLHDFTRLIIEKPTFLLQLKRFKYMRIFEEEVQRSIHYFRHW